MTTATAAGAGAGAEAPDGGGSGIAEAAMPGAAALSPLITVLGSSAGAELESEADARCGENGCAFRAPNMSGTLLDDFCEVGAAAAAGWACAAAGGGVVLDGAAAGCVTCAGTTGAMFVLATVSAGFTTFGEGVSVDKAEFADWTCATFGVVVTGGAAGVDSADLVARLPTGIT